MTKPILILIGALVVLTSEAAIKNFTFSGTVGEVQDPFLRLDGSITNGTPLQGFYIFDTDIADSNADGTVGDYRNTNSACGVVVKMGNYVFRTNPRKVDFLIEVVNRETDNYLFRSYLNVSSQPVDVGHIAWQLDDSTGSALGDALLPLTPPDLADFQSVFGLTIRGGGSEMEPGFFLRGAVTSIEEAPAVIPERPETTIDDAVEVSWPSRLGYFYQVQISEDMNESWTNVGEPMLGDGTVLKRYFPKEKGKKVFYRAEIANFSQ
ncbi:MAG: hypothetical protein ACXW32_01140 [Limisphaerales bacterium]